MPVDGDHKLGPIAAFSARPRRASSRSTRWRGAGATLERDNVRVAAATYENHAIYLKVFHGSSAIGTRFALGVATTSGQSLKGTSIVNTDLKLARQVLELQLKEAASSRGLGDSIHIQQLADPVDMTQEAAERDVAVQLIDRESTLVRRLRSSIDRIENASYGICLECEEEIAPKRLKAIPWAELCISCQERADDLASHGERMPKFKHRTEAA
jgi:DnaK suppressor protein